VSSSRVDRSFDLQVKFYLIAMNRWTFAACAFRDALIGRKQHFYLLLRECTIFVESNVHGLGDELVLKLTGNLEFLCEHDFLLPFYTPNRINYNDTDDRCSTMSKKF
jgi:hypothetical protein